MNQNKKNAKQLITLDEKHNDILNQFHINETEYLPKLEEDIVLLKSRAKELKSNQIDEYMDIKDKIKQKKLEIKRIKSEKKKYLLENSQFIFNYFEEKKDISSGGGKQNTNILNSFFKLDKTANLIYYIYLKKKINRIRQENLTLF